ncbi:hypothetical protein C8R45DRAFT_1219376 [Mycena sanguinolenta]|nr:hypothetical protein C8R45DRAFT_1219376 [Mycena sanguinolenta]
MNLAGASIRAAVLEQMERTRQCSKAEIERFIKESELEVISLQSQISALTEFRDSQHASVLALKYIVSPIRSLPVELLVEILEYAIEDKNEDETRFLLKIVYCITHVCSDWRQIAHRTPSLWTRLRVDLCTKKDVADELKAWLARCALMPIHLSFMMLWRGRAINLAVLNEVLKIAPRWGSVQFDVSGMKLPMLEQIVQCQFDNLEEIDIRMSLANRPIAFTSVPRLRKLTLNCHTTMPQTLVPWAQLTELNLNCHTLDVALEVLRQCVHLTRAEIGISEFPDEVEDTPVVQCSQLRILALHLLFLLHITPVFDYLSAPALQTLALFSNDPYWEHARFTAFQLRTPNITCLEFNSQHYLTSQDLGAAIRHAPSLASLIIRFCDDCFDDAFIHTLYYKDDVVPLAPHLHILIVQSNDAKFTEDILAGMIASRWWTDAELASLPVPPAVARWTFVDLDLERYDWGLHFVATLKDIPSRVLIYSEEDIV